MIERKIVSQKIKEFDINEFISQNLKRIGHSGTKVQRTPLGDKIIISASRPGLVVGRKGQSIKKLTEDLKKKFNLENPQIEINEVENLNLDANIVAERIESSLERFGTQRFKGLGHKIMSEVMGSGALGVEILISGKVPGARAKRWRFYQGYLKKCGDIAVTGVRTAYASANLKSGTVGIQVRIMPSNLKLPDDIKLREKKEVITEEVKEEPKEAEAKKAEKESAPKKEPAKKRKAANPKKAESKEDKK